MNAAQGGGIKGVPAFSVVLIDYQVPAYDLIDDAGMADPVAESGAVPVGIDYIAGND
ncbi:hypothetical protein [Leifsonia sp. P73]|uniref:hypothetical protein n=1 Tax=Leifsonia sp. P73 TaxID=3423959 RepID=UPI003DA5051E